jgi:hypothetical protein
MTTITVNHIGATRPAPASVLVPKSVVIVHFHVL